MGRLRRSRTHKAQRDIHRASRTRARTKDLDQIQLIDLDPKRYRSRPPVPDQLRPKVFPPPLSDDMVIPNRAALEAQPLDFDKPGLAQHYCVECAKYYETDTALRSHWRSKVHKKRCRALKEPAYTIEESERAAGLCREEKRPSSTTSTWMSTTASTVSAVAAATA